MLASKNPHVKEQSDFHIASRHVQHFEDAFQGMLKSSARAITTNRVKAEMAKIYGDASKVPPAIRDILTHTVPATGTARTVGQKAAESIILKRMGLTREVADAVVFLASEASSYITAQTINVNGGLYF